MILRWMLAATLFSGGVIVGALLFEASLRSMKWPTRFAWVIALAIAALVPWWWTGPGATGTEDLVLTQVQVAPEETSFVEEGRSSQGTDQLLLLAWFLATALLLLNRGVSAWRIRGRARSWRRSELLGEKAWVSHDVGPALVGVLRPQIVVPQWLLAWGGSALTLVLRHEGEHQRAGDAWLRFVGFLVVAAQPWNLGLWYIARRMDLAIEVDCDARVLRHTQDIRPYAELLVEVARMVVPVRPAPAGFSHSASRLERRLLMLASLKNPRQYGRSSLTLAAAVMVIFGLQSCSRPESPTADFVQSAEDGGSAEPELAEDGTLVLPGTPEPGRIAAELDSRHPDVASSGLPANQSVWFLLDEDSRVSRSGVATTDGLVANLQAEYPAEASDFALMFTHEAQDGTEVNVLWMIPPPPPGSLPAGQ